MSGDGARDGEERSPHSTDSARAAAGRDDLAGWVDRFLRSPGSDNPGLAQLLADPPRSWLGPVQLPIDRLHRLAGPPGSPALRTVDDDEWRDDVDELAERIDVGHDAPPVVVSYRDDTLILEDGNHRVEALRRAGETDAWAVIAFEDPEDRDRFIARSQRLEP